MPSFFYQLWNRLDRGLNSIHVLVRREDFTLDVTSGDSFRVVVGAQAQKSEEIQNFVRGSEKHVDNSDLTIEVGDKGVKCIRGYENDRLKSIKGVCINTITLVIPANMQSKVYVNEKPIDEQRAITTDELIKGLDRLGFVDNYSPHRQTLVQAFLARAKSTRVISVSQLADALNRFYYEDKRLEIVRLFKSRVTDPQNADAISSAFKYSADLRNQAIDALKE